MRPSRPVFAFLTVLSLLALLLSSASLLALPASAAAVRYVALGDSYSSGDGAGSYDSAAGNCLRSTNAYAPKWAAAHSPTSFRFAACAGATTASVISGQLSALSADTTLVSMTVGGNDVGFADVMQTCVLGSTSECQSAVANAKNLATTRLPGRLADLYARIRTASPSAHVVVLDYPHLYIITSTCVGLNNTKRTALNSGADVLDDAIAKATADAGYTFADVRSRFAGHELCSGDGWLHSVTVPIAESYHPTSTGQISGYLPVFTGAA